DETRPAGRHPGAVERLRARLPPRDGRTRCRTCHRAARGAVATQRLLRWLLLRAREPLPPFGAARAARRRGRRHRVTREPTMIRIREIDHLVLRVADLDTMLRFYCNTLGCAVVRRRDDI